MNYGDIGRTVFVGQKVAGDRTLLIVAPNDTKYIWAAFVCHLGVGGCGRYHENSGIFIDFAGGERTAGTEMAGNEDDTLVYQLSGNRLGLSCFAGIVHGN